MQAAGDLVALAAELAAGVELRQHDRQRRQALLRHDVDRDARTVVDHRHGVVRMNGHVDRVSTSSERLVDRVVHHLVDEMMKPSRARRADVHARPQPDGLEALENGDVFGGISSLSHEKSPASEAFPGLHECIRPHGRQRLLRGSPAQLFLPICADLPTRCWQPRRGPRAPDPASPPGAAQLAARRRPVSLRSRRPGRIAACSEQPRREPPAAGQISLSSCCSSNAQADELAFTCRIRSREAARARRFVPPSRRPPAARR